jgi:hypothetical protein
MLRADNAQQEALREHRWSGPSGSIIDSLPAGPGLRQAVVIGYLAVTERGSSRARNLI